jgi:antirestriction protein ArdC
LPLRVIESGDFLPCSQFSKKSVSIHNWLKVLKNDKKLLVMSSAQAQKSADYILNRKEDHEEYMKLLNK